MPPRGPFVPATQTAKSGKLCHHVFGRTAREKATRNGPELTHESESYGKLTPEESGTELDAN